MVSVIIPTFNEEKVLLDCLESLDKQKLKDFEVIIIDDGSTDNTYQLAKSFSPSNYKLTVHKKKHEGPALARNFGAKRARGDILVFIDADMTFTKVFLKKLISPIVSKNIAGTFSKEEYVQNWDNLWSRYWNLNQNLPVKKRLPKNYPNKQKVFRAIKKDKFDKVGGFEKSGYTDDYSLSEKLGEYAVNATGARFFHKNPDTLREVFTQAKWSAKRKYKLGAIGTAYTFIKSILPFSLIIGIFKSIINISPLFWLFKIIYDFGIIIGLFEYFLLHDGAK